MIAKLTGLKWCIHTCSSKNDNYGSRRYARARQTGERNKGVIFKNRALFTGCIREINNLQIDNANYLDVVMPMYIYLKTSGSLGQMII